MSKRLKPCPFCGGKADGPRVCMGLVHPEKIPALWIIECKKCNAEVYSSESEEATTKAWNTRAEQAIKEIKQ